MNLVVRLSYLSLMTRRHFNCQEIKCADELRVHQYADERNVRKIPCAEEKKFLKFLKK